MGAAGPAQDLLALEKEVSSAHKTLMEGTGEGNDFLGWLNLPSYEQTEEMRRIAQAADRIRETSEVFVVVGIGGSTWAHGLPLNSHTATITTCSGASKATPGSSSPATACPPGLGTTCPPSWTGRTSP